jgi:hypothetical protein
VNIIWTASNFDTFSTRLMSLPNTTFTAPSTGYYNVSISGNTTAGNAPHISAILTYSSGTITPSNVCMYYVGTGGVYPSYREALIYMTAGSVFYFNSQNQDNSGITANMVLNITKL